MGNKPSIDQQVFDAVAKSKQEKYLQLVSNPSKLPTNLFSQKFTQGRTLLHVAIQTNCDPIINSLINLHSDVNARCATGATCLHFACDRNNAALVDKLVQCGADPTAIDRAGLNPLEYAKSKRFTPVVRSLEVHMSSFTGTLSQEHCSKFQAGFGFVFGQDAKETLIANMGGDTVERWVVVTRLQGKASMAMNGPLQCPHCNLKLQPPVSGAGRVQCTCKNVFAVPAPKPAVVNTLTIYSDPKHALPIAVYQLAQTVDVRRQYKSGHLVFVTVTVPVDPTDKKRRSSSRTRKSSSQPRWKTLRFSSVDERKLKRFGDALSQEIRVLEPETDTIPVAQPVPESGGRQQPPPTIAFNVVEAEAAGVAVAAGTAVTFNTAPNVPPRRSPPGTTHPQTHHARSRSDPPHTTNPPFPPPRTTSRSRSHSRSRSCSRSPSPVHSPPSAPTESMLVESSLPHTKTCTRCNFANALNSRSCVMCGHDLVASSQRELAKAAAEDSSQTLQSVAVSASDVTVLDNSSNEQRGGQHGGATGQYAGSTAQHAGSTAQHAGSTAQHAASNAQHAASNAQHAASSAQHAASSAQHSTPTRVSNQHHIPTFDTEDDANPFLCPITREEMVDPVLTADGMTYERKAIEDWFRRGNTTSPLTGQDLASQHLTPNVALRHAIQYSHQQRGNTGNAVAM